MHYNATKNNKIHIFFLNRSLLELSDYRIGFFYEMASNRTAVISDHLSGNGKIA